MPVSFGLRSRGIIGIVALLALIASLLAFGATAASAEESSNVPAPDVFDRDGLDQDEIVVPETYPSSPSGIPDPRSVDYILVPEGRGLSASDNPHSTYGATSVTIEARYRAGWGLAGSWTFTFTNGKSTQAPNKFWVQRGKCDKMHSRTPLNTFVQNTKDAGGRYLPDVRVRAERIPDGWSPVGDNSIIGRLEDGKVGSLLLANYNSGEGLLPGKYNIIYYGDWARSGRPVGAPIGKIQVFIPSCDGRKPPPGTPGIGSSGKTAKPKSVLRQRKHRVRVVVNNRKVAYVTRVRLVGFKTQYHGRSRIVQREGFRVMPNRRVSKIYRTKSGVRYRLAVRVKINNKWTWRVVSSKRHRR